MPHPPAAVLVKTFPPFSRLKHRQPQALWLRLCRSQLAACPSGRAALVPPYAV